MTEGSTELQEEEQRLLRRKEVLVQDLDRFDRVEPLEQTAVLDRAALLLSSCFSTLPCVICFLWSPGFDPENKKKLLFSTNKILYPNNII